MKLKIKKLHKDAVIPHYATEGAAGFDLTAVRADKNIDGAKSKFYFGLAFEIPIGYVGLLFPRSSIEKFCHRMSCCVGVIDSDFTGEVSATFDHSDYGNEYNVGDRVAQMVIVPFIKVDFEEVEELTTTKRGTGGHGSTGR